MTSGTSASPQVPRLWRPRVAVRGLAAAGMLILAGSAFAVAQEPTLDAAPPPAPSMSLAPSVEDRLQAAETELRQLIAERERLQSALTGLADLYEPMETDRQLLLELRKALPVARPDAESYLARMQGLALRSDPTRLSQLASRVLETAPVFLDWRDTDFASPEEASQAYRDTGASGFNTDFEEFRTAILLTVANRLDALLTLQDRLR